MGFFFHQLFTVRCLYGLLRPPQSDGPVYQAVLALIQVPALGVSIPPLILHLIMSMLRILHDL